MVPFGLNVTRWCTVTEPVSETASPVHGSVSVPARGNVISNVTVCCADAGVGARVGPHSARAIPRSAGAQQSRRFIVLFSSLRSEEHTSELQSRRDLVCR